MPSLFKKGNRYYIRVYADGKPREISTKTSDIREARRQLAAAKKEHAATPFRARSRIPLSVLVESFVEHIRATERTPNFLNDLSRLRQVFGTGIACLNAKASGSPTAPERTILTVKYAEDITTAMVNRYLEGRIKVLAPKTANHERGILHRMYEYALANHGFVHADIRVRNPVSDARKFREALPPVIFLERADIPKQLDALSGHPNLRAGAAIMIYAGLRREEAATLTWRDIDFNAGRISVSPKTVSGEHWQPKTGKARAVPISPPLREELLAWRAKAPKGTEWVMCLPTGRRMTPEYFTMTLRRVNRAKGLSWTAQQFRHTFGTHLAHMGKSMWEISQLMGNSPRICEQHYISNASVDRRIDIDFMAERGGTASDDERARRHGNDKPRAA